MWLYTEVQKISWWFISLRWETKNFLKIIFQNAFVHKDNKGQHEGLILFILFYGGSVTGEVSLGIRLLCFLLFAFTVVFCSVVTVRYIKIRNVSCSAVSPDFFPEQLLFCHYGVKKVSNFTIYECNLCHLKGQ